MTTRSRITLLLAAALLAASAAAAGAITDVRFQNTGAAQANVPVTFGQVFAAGDMKKADILVGKLDGATVPLQVDVKATHADGSVRHAIISAIVPKLAAGATGTMTLNTGGAVPAGSAAPADLVAAGFSASTSATIAGVKYSASADQLLKAGVKATWLAGAVANEWQVSAPLTTAAGAAHPHLQARFAIRYYTAVKKARVDVTIENAWAYEPGPQNFTYDADVTVGGKSVYTKAGLTHYHHARWRKVFWYGDAPAVNVQSNVPYLISSRAVPNYDQSIKVADAPLAAIANTFTGPRTEPMGVGMAVAYMPTTGGRDDIGLLPMWSVAYLLSMDQRALTATMGTGDLAGSWSTHYRDRNTDRPISLLDYPAMSLGRASDTYNEATKKFDAFPECTACETPYQVDTSHQASFAYLPYLLTGDHYYLEELQFWAMWNVFGETPAYRQWAKGLVQSGQARAQAWSMRTLAEAAYITPDADALKKQFATILDTNLTWYNDTYVNNAATSNNLGVLVNGYALSYQNGTGVAPWQDDFFTAAIGHAVDLGFTKAAPLLAWKAKSPVLRMTDPGTCWIDGAVYALIVKPSAAGAVYSTFGEAFKASHAADFNALACNSPEMAKLLGMKVGEMTGYSSSVAGYPSNMQPALAYAVDAGIPKANEAWAIFQARAVKPDYSNGPQFAIVPHAVAAGPVVTPPAPPVVVPPAIKPGKVTTPSNTKLKSLKGLTASFFDPAKLAQVKTFTSVTTTSKGAFSVADAALVPGVAYAVLVTDASGKVLDVMYPVTAQ
jgi:hypothetical protein